jgi:hypothetical protein
MKKTKPFWLFAWLVVGLVLEQITAHFYGGSAVLASLITLFAFLIGLSIWYKIKDKPKKPN